VPAKHWHFEKLFMPTFRIVRHIVAVVVALAFTLEASPCAASVYHKIPGQRAGTKSGEQRRRVGFAGWRRTVRKRIEKKSDSTSLFKAAVEEWAAALAASSSWLGRGPNENGSGDSDISQSHGPNSTKSANGVIPPPLAQQPRNGSTGAGGSHVGGNPGIADVVANLPAGDPIFTWPTDSLPSNQNPAPPPGNSYPNTPPTNNYPDTPPTNNFPETPPTNNYPDTPPTNNYPETPPTNNYPETPPTNNYPETPPTNNYPDIPPTNSNPNPPPGYYPSPPPANVTPEPTSLVIWGLLAIVTLPLGTRQRQVRGA
jgi:hypothetical protein